MNVVGNVLSYQRCSVKIKIGRTAQTVELKLKTEYNNWKNDRLLQLPPSKKLITNSNLSYSIHVCTIKFHFAWGYGTGTKVS